jgi:integrase
MTNHTDSATTTRGGAKTKSHAGVVRKRTPAEVKGGWEYRLELGEQVAQRCDACGTRHWLEGARLKVCPSCKGELCDVRERRQVAKGGFHTKKAAQAALDDAKVARRGGRFTVVAAKRGQQTLAEFLTDVYLPWVKLNRKPTTWQTYKTTCECYVIPRLGSCRLQDLSPLALHAFRTELHGTGRIKRPGEGLSARTVRHVHVILHGALQHAVDVPPHRLATNPATGAKLPDVAEDPEMKCWTAQERRAFLEATTGDRHHALWCLLSTMGLRRGEALGLRWEDVRIWQDPVLDKEGEPVLDDEGEPLTVEKGSVSITRNFVSVGGRATLIPSPKTRKGRAVPLPSTVIAALKEQASLQLADHDRWGDAWGRHFDTGEPYEPFVFTLEDGRPMHPERVTVVFHEAAQAAGLPRIRLHDLRHTAATLALQAGVPVSVVSQWLGHNSATMTLDTYAHVLPEMNNDALARVEATLKA